tara:strand:- start:1296 stop:3845 length:2550 start_codon:yes stop_codon:yes gene_type:complete
LRSFVFIIIVSSFSGLRAEENIIDGLLFNSIYDDLEGRNGATSLTIPSKDAIIYEKNLTIDFDVFFWRKNPFGFILSAGNEQDPNLFVLSYSDYKSQDTSFIELTYADRPSIISIPILDKDQGWEKWKNIKLYFEMEKQRVGLSFQNQNIIWYKEGIPIDNRMQFNFGATSFVTEPPRMAIKDIHINRDKKKTILWKLDEEFGDIAHPNYENGTSWAGQVKNGIWIHELHRQLNPVFNHKVYKNNFQFLGVDDQTNQYLYLMNDSLFYYDNKRGRIVEKYSFPYLPEDNYIYRYNPVKKMIFATHGGGGGPISYLDLEKKIWENYVERYESDGLFFTSNFLYDYVSHDIFTLGGYGWYEQKNILQKYNSQDLSWYPIKYKTISDNLFLPRCKAEISYDNKSKKYLLYGGQGNESGKQQQGFRRLNDYWEIDLINFEFNRIWEDSSKIIEPMDNHPKVAISVRNQKVYKMLGSQVSNKNNSFIVPSKLEVFVSSFKNRAFKKYIIDTKEDQKNDIHIIDFHSLDSSNELLVIYQKNNLDDKYVVFSTIKTPLITKAEQKKSHAEFFILILVGCCIFVFLLTTKLGEEDKKDFTKKDPLLSLNNQKESTVNQGLSISLINSLEIVNQGHSVTSKDWKSKKARNLFIFIILKGKNGASLNEIHNLFWPDVNLESARNSRAVALSRIRRVISPFDNLLVSKEEIIKFEDNEDVFIDYRNLYYFINVQAKKNYNSMYPVKLINDGQLLKFSNSNWVESYRLDISEKISIYAKSLVEIFIKQKKWDKVGFIGNKLLLLNCFHDDGMRYSVLANKMLNKNALSHKVYNDFIKKYELESREKYPDSYNNILSHYKMD